MPFSDDVQKAAIAGAFGLVGTLIPAAISWSHDRSSTAARNRTLEEATKRLAFWDQWLKIRAQITLPEDEIPLELHKELTLLSEIIQKDSVFAHTEQIKFRGKSSAFQKTLDDLPLWRRLLLFYSPARSTAWLPRLFFYVGLFFAALIPFGLAAPKDPLTLKDFAIAEAVFIVWIFIFRSLSTWLEQPRHPADATPSTSVPPPPRPA